MTARKISPLYDTARALGAEFGDHDGWHLPEAFTTEEQEIAAARSRVVLADETPNGKLMIEGLSAEPLLERAYGRHAPAIGSGIRIPSGQAYRLRQDLLFLSTAPEAVEETGATLMQAATDQEELITITDVTHGRTEIRALGPAGPELLSKVCGLDFSEQAFGDSTAKQSSLAKTPHLIIRRDIGRIPAFSLIGGRSFGAYVWKIVLEAGRDWDIIPIGWKALRILENSEESQGENTR